MTRKFDEADDELPSEYPYDDEYSDSDYASLHEDEDLHDGSWLNHYENITFEDVKIRPVHMKRLKVGDAVLHVFSNGAIRRDSFENTSFGFSLAGTPFRTYTLEYKQNEFRTYFMHELVWQAFHGSPPSGWEVRHKPEYTMFARKMYSNALHHLNLYPSIVSKLI